MKNKIDLDFLIPVVFIICVCICLCISEMCVKDKTIEEEKTKQLELQKELIQLQQEKGN